jgi:ParB family chromosome partitioning protein
MPLVQIEPKCQHIDSTVNLEINALKSPSWMLRPLKEELIAELERSIRNTGLLQPIVVRKVEDGHEVVFGNHRLEACKRLGMNRISAIVADFSEDEAFLARVSENLLRNTYINPIEEAEGYRMLVSKGWSIDAIGLKVGKSDSYICERLGILERLSHEVRSQVLQGSLTPSHAEIISRIRDTSLQEMIASLVVRKRLSVHTLENMIKNVPLPTQVQITRVSGEYIVRIPHEFAKVVGLESDQRLFIYARRGKLILEKVSNTSK